MTSRSLREKRFPMSNIAIAVCSHGRASTSGSWGTGLYITIRFRARVFHADLIETTHDYD